MLNLKTSTQSRGVVTSGNLGTPTLRRGSTSIGMGTYPAGGTTIMALPLALLTPDQHGRSSQQPRSMLTETLERLGAPMMESGEEFEGEYQKIVDLSINLAEDLRPSSRSLGRDRKSVSPISLPSLNQAPTRELGSP